MTRVWLGLFLLALARTAGADPDPVVRIARPTERYLIDEMSVLVEVSPPAGANVDSVEIRVDGKLVATIKTPPYEIRYDFGEQLHPHRLEALAHLSDGTTHAERFDSAGADLNYQSQVNLVTLTVAVQDRSGRYVMDLGQERFRVLENGRPQKITYFANETQPLKLALALDCSGSMEPRMPALKASACRFVDRKRPEDEMMIVRFNHMPSLARDFTAKSQALKAAIGMLRTGGGTRIYDAVYASLMSLKPARGQRAVVVLTDGLDESNRTGGGGADVTLEEAIHTSRDLQVPVYTIGLGQEVDHAALQSLADRSGGRAFFPLKSEDMESAYDQIRQDLDHRYTLAYQSSNQAEPGQWMQVEVRVDDPLLNVHASEGYAAGEESEDREP
jgi:VWFA-related protein